MKKKTVFFITVIVAVVVCVCIYDNYTDKRIHNEKIELGKKNACEWMSRKYGIDVESVDAEVDMDDDIFSTFEGNTVFVTVHEGNKEYHVDISGIEENADGCDDYQAEEIENAVINMIKADIKDFEYDFYTYGMYRQRYHADDTNSLKDVLSEQNESLYVYCVNNDFEEVPVFDFLRRNIAECKFYSFSSHEILNDFIENGSSSFIDRYAPFITGYRVVDFPKRSNENRKYNLEKYNDLLYYLPYENVDGKLEKGFEEISESDFDIKDSNYEFISAYGLKEKYGNIIVWIPVPEDKKDKEFYFDIEYYEYDKKVQKTEKCDIIGGYAVYEFWTYMTDRKIALLCK